MNSSSFLSQFTGNTPDFYDETQDDNYEYASEDDDLFSTASIKEHELDVMDELREESPDDLIAPESNAKAGNIESISRIFENCIK